MKKLRNNSGATMLMAILLILVAAVVSAVILTAATSAARHLRSDRQAQQNYLAVSSAAELIRDSVLKDSYYWEQVSKKEKNEETGEETTVIESETETRPDGLLGLFENLWAKFTNRDKDNDKDSKKEVQKAC